MRKFKKNLFFILLTSIYTFLLITTSNKHVTNGYYITQFIPYFYFVIFYFNIYDNLLCLKSPFLIFFSIISFFRYVVLSYVIISSNDFIGISRINPRNDTVFFASILMIWELFIVTLFIALYNRKKSKEKKIVKELSITNNYSVTFVYVLIVILAIFLFPEARQGVSFFSSVSRLKNYEVNSNISLLIREIIINSKYFLLFGIISFLKFAKINNKRISSSMSYLIVIFISIFIVGIRVGGNRKLLLQDSIAIIMLLFVLFPEKKKITIFGIGSVGLILILSTSITRSLTDTSFDFFKTFYDVNTLQAYFPGQYNISIAVEAKEFYGDMFTLRDYFLSLLRPVLGVGSIVKNINFNYVNNMFATRMSQGLHTVRTDQIFPMIGQGYFYFGAFLSPIFSVVAAYIGLKFEDLFYKTQSIELFFISSYMIVYLSQFMVLNTTIITNSLTFKLPIFFIIYLITNMFSKGI